MNSTRLQAHVLSLLLALPWPVAAKADAPSQPAEPTRKLEVRGDRPFLGGKPIDLWGLRSGNALMSDAITQRHINALDSMTAHGINCLGVYIQGSNGGWPDVNAGRNGYTPEGALKPAFARRLEWLVRAADRRGMVIMIGLFSPRKDQELEGEKAVQRAIEETAQLLSERKLRNVFVDLFHEFNSPRVDLDIFREPSGTEKKARLTQWFQKVAPEIPVGVCPCFQSGTADSYPGMQVRIIQKGAAIPTEGFVVNVETPREDKYEDEGIFTVAARKRMEATWQEYRSKPNAFLLFHAAYIQGITGKEGTGPHPEMGGDGSGPDDRGVRFYFEWVKQNVGPYHYPDHARGRR